MSDHKFDRSIDRQAVLDDLKRRIIDLMENPYVVPDVGIYDEPVRYFKANEEWCKIIFGWLDWLEDVAGWQDAEDDNHAGIQAILIFEEGIEPVEPNPTDTYEAIKFGIYDAFNDLAKQIVSGRTTNISVDDTGAVSDPSDTEGAELPEDDENTPQDESAMARSGGASGVRLGINQIWTFLNASYTASPQVPAGTASDRLQYLFKLDEIKTDYLCDYYYGERLASNPYVASFASTLDSYLYCKGITKQSIAEWILEVHTANQRDMALLVLDALTDEQLAAWFDRGTHSPSTDYLAYSCVPIPTYSFNITAFGSDFNDTHVLKKYHRYLVTVTGYFVDVDGDIQDAFWHKQVGQNEVFELDMSIQILNATKRYPTVFEVPFDTTNHKYAWTIEMGQSDASAQWTLNRDATIAVGATSPTGGLHFIVQDLGEIVN